MQKKPTYEELEQRVKELEQKAVERNQLEEDLRQSEVLFRTLVETSPFGISIMKFDKSFDYFNPKFTEVFGYTLEDLPDKQTWFEKAYPDETYRKEVVSVWKEDLVDNMEIGEIITPAIEHINVMRYRQPLDA